MCVCPPPPIPVTHPPPHPPHFIFLIFFLFYFISIKNNRKKRQIPAWGTSVLGPGEVWAGWAQPWGWLCPPSCPLSLSRGGAGGCRVPLVSLHPPPIILLPVASVGFSGVKPSPRRPPDHVPSRPPPVRGRGAGPAPRDPPNRSPRCQQGHSGAGCGALTCLLLAAGGRAPACALPALGGRLQRVVRGPPKPPVSPPPRLPGSGRGGFLQLHPGFVVFLPIPTQLPGGDDPSGWGGGSPPGLVVRVGAPPILCLRTVLAQLGVISVTSVFFKLHSNIIIPV